MVCGRFNPKRAASIVNTSVAGLVTHPLPMTATERPGPTRSSGISKEGPMEGSRSHSTPKSGEPMSSNHLTEADDAINPENRTEPPPSAAGDQPASGKRKLIARSKRPSFLELLSALWAAEDRLERQQPEQDSEMSTQVPEKKEE